ncbi:PQQ-binding-like beta-propeller repeat protein [Candidatus Hydrogenedentota bacterium]
MLIMKKLFLAFVCVVLLVSYCPFAQAAGAGTSSEMAEHLISVAGVSRGICSIINFSDEALPVEMAAAGGFLVHALSNEETMVSSARALAEANGVDGSRLIIEKYSAGELPYVDNLVDLVVIIADNTNSIPSRDEILRVLRPGGVAVLDNNEILMKKPVPEGADEWTHWFHRPDNNPVSTDTLAKPPYRLRWIRTPRYTAMPTNTTIAGGRVFHAMGHIAHHKREEPNLYTLTARNGYNGTELWRRKLPEGYAVHRSAFVATTDDFYMIDGSGCLVLDPETGKEKKRISITEIGDFWKWIAIQNDVLYILAGPREDDIETTIVGKQTGGWGWKALDKGYYEERLPYGFGRTVAAYDLKTERLLWSVTEGDSDIDSRGMALSDNKLLYYAPDARVVCLEVATGKPLWKNEDSEVRELIEENTAITASRMGFRTAAYALFTEEAILFAPDPRVNVVALSSKDGSFLWSKQRKGGPMNALYADDVFYMEIGKKPSTRALDPLTGEILEDLGFGKMNCTRFTGSPYSFFSRGEGFLQYDRAKKKAFTNVAFRPGCNDGVIAANGLLYVTPWLCDCNLQMMGMVAMGPGGKLVSKRSDASRLELGEDDVRQVSSMPKTGEDWTTYRGDNRRSGSTCVAVPKKAAKLWDRKAGASTPTVCAGVMTFFGTGNGKIRALDSATGNEEWSFSTGGAIKAPPSFWNDRLYVGSGDGYVYALEAATGRMLWRFLAAPEARRFMLYGALSSLWPVNTGVLIDKGVAYFAAGILDTEGTYVYALDALSGEKVWANSDSGHLNKETGKGVSAQGCLTIAGDMLLLAGGNALSVGRYDIKTGECLNEAPPHVVGRAANRSGHRGREVMAFSERHILHGGTAYYSDDGALINPGSFFVNDIDGPWDIGVGNLIGQGALPPTWSDRVFVSRNGREGPLECYGLDEVTKSLVKRLAPAAADHERKKGKGPARQLDTAFGRSLWNIDLPEGENVRVTAIARNAVIAVTGSTLSNVGEIEWRVSALSIDNGSELWRKALPLAPLPGGIAVDDAGRVSVVLVDGGILCFGRESSL